MFCRNCGKQNDENAFRCVGCGAELHGGLPLAEPAENIPNYLVFSILCTFFCCLPFGVVAIIYSSQVNGLVAAGNIQAAKDSAKKAKLWCIVSASVSAAVFVLYFFFILVVGVAQVATQQH
jgi:Interferon-induced transmembrane protein